MRANIRMIKNNIESECIVMVNNKKNSKKIGIIVTIAIVLVLAIIGVVLYFVLRPKETMVGEVKKVEVREQCPIDFSSYQAINPEVYAYIEVPGTDISYPILQSGTDDLYYAYHTIEGNDGLPGAIYTEGMNSKDFHDANTIVYGHNMRNGSMFQQLHRFEDEEFFNSNDTFYIYTPEHKYTYKIFASCCTSDDHPLYKYDFTTGSGVLQYVAYLQSINDSYSHYRNDVSINSDTKLCTLLTCMPSGMDDKRYVVVGCLTEIYDYAAK